MNKQLFYDQMYSLVSDEPDIIANLANISAFIYDTFEDINWAGFYFLKDKELVLGPFQGKVACTRIPLGKGVVGTSAYRREIIRVADVFQFVGHIACDSKSRSEIVLPLIIDNEVIGVLDIDSPSFNRFTLKDEEILKGVMTIIKEAVYEKDDE